MERRKKEHSYVTKDALDWRLSVGSALFLTCLNTLLWHLIFSRPGQIISDTLLIMFGAGIQWLVCGARLFGHERDLSRYSEKRSAVVMGNRYEETREWKSFYQQLGGAGLVSRAGIGALVGGVVLYFLGPLVSFLSIKLFLMFAIAFMVDLLWAPLLVSAAFLFISAVTVYGGLSWSAALVGAIVGTQICFFQWLVFKIKESDRIPGLAGPVKLLAKEWLGPALKLAAMIAVIFLLLPKQDFMPLDPIREQRRAERSFTHTVLQYLQKLAYRGADDDAPMTVGSDSVAGRQIPKRQRGSDSSADLFTNSRSGLDRKVGEGRYPKGTTQQDSFHSLPTVRFPQRMASQKSLSRQEMQQLMEQLTKLKVELPGQPGLKGQSFPVADAATYSRRPRDYVLQVGEQRIRDPKLQQDYFEFMQDVGTRQKMLGQATRDPEVLSLLDQQLQNTASQLSSLSTPDRFSPLSQGSEKGGDVGSESGSQDRLQSGRSSSEPRTLGVRRRSPAPQGSNSSAAKQLTEPLEKKRGKKFHVKDLLLFGVVCGTLLLLYYLLPSKKNKRPTKRRTQKQVSKKHVRAAQQQLQLQIKNVSQSNQPIEVQVVLLYNSLLRFFERIGFEKPRHFTPDEYCLAISSRFRQVKPPLGQVTAVFLNTLYGRRVPSQSVFVTYSQQIQVIANQTSSLC